MGGNMPKINLRPHWGGIDWRFDVVVIAFFVILLVCLCIASLLLMVVVSWWAIPCLVGVILLGGAADTLIDKVLEMDGEHLL